jgi:transporter family protein
MNYTSYALIAAVAASATAILAKIGVKDVPSHLATAVRTTVVLVFAWGIATATGEFRAVPKIGTRSLVFLALSGIATGVSWLAYFRALQLGPASRVAPIDKASLGLTVILSAVVLHEPMSWKLLLGVAFIVGGSLLTMSG